MHTGIIASAYFLPMRTNIYDPYVYNDIVSTEWLVNFHAKFGYNRKALYIDTNVDAAINWQRTGTRGELKVCTLEDLLFAEKDIVLYLDDNLYNVNTLAEIIDKAYTRIDNVDEDTDTRGLYKKITDAIIGVFDESMVNLAKTAEVTTYSSKVERYKDERRFNNLLFFSLDEEGGTSSPQYQSELAYLSPDDLWDTETNAPRQDDSGSTASAYTPLTAFATISGIYREKELFTSLNSTLNKNTPVFVSSPTLPYTQEADLSDIKTIYNYLQLM